MWQEIKNIYHFFQAVAASIRFGFPANDLIVVGVTGTDGKTTTSNLIFHILKRAGYKTAIISTVSAIIDDQEFDTGFHVSTPDSFALQSYLRKAKDLGVTHVVLEVTSHAIDQYRIWGIPLSVGVLTNVTREHIDYHKTYDRYLKIKLRLLEIAEIAVVNRDDESYDAVMKHIGHRAEGEIITYGVTEDAAINLQTLRFSSPLVGEYNTYNTLAAIAATRVLSVPDEVIVAAIASFKPPKGRAEIVHQGEFTVMIDFAHTPNSLKHILRAVKAQLPDGGRIIHVFGAAGERDSGKRVEMGWTSSQYADVIVLTSEDPRNEPAEEIIEQIASGIDVKKYTSILYKAPDRQEAIGQAILMAKPGDFVVITGKGHEKSMNYGQGEVAWSEEEAVEKALHRRTGGSVS